MPPPKSKGPSFWSRAQSMLGGGGTGRGAGAPARQSAPRDGGSRQSAQPIWIRYKSAMPIVAILLLVVLIGGGALLLMSWLSPSGQVLTVTRPSGGTLSGSGIRCGTSGTDCSARRPNGDTVELTAQADTGFVFRGYSGDCAPGGLMIMNAAKTCGATFEQIDSSKPPPATQTLTIDPVPTGGTLEGVDILCGTKGSVCSANHPDGVPVDLHPMADEGFTFMGFGGDCAPLGHTQMTGARKCSATFQRTDSLKPAAAANNRGIQPTRGGPPPQPQPPPPSGNQPGPSTTQVARGGTTSTGQPQQQPPPPVNTTPQGGNTVPPQTGGKDGGDVKAPVTDEDYAKGVVKDVLKEYCAAYEALSPDAVQRVFPKANMNTLKLQLNKSAYKSMQCTFTEPKYDALDTNGGTAQINLEIKHVYERTALGDKPEVFEYIAKIAFSRASQRGRWVIEKADYRLKPKEK